MDASKWAGQTGGTNRGTAPDSAVLKRRMLLMGGAVVLIVGANVVSWWLGSQDEQPDDAYDLPEITLTEESVERPDIDVAGLEALVADSEPVDRVVLERPAVDLLLDQVQVLQPAHMRMLEPRLVDANVAAEILTDPSAVRGDAFRARGWIEELRTHRPQGKSREEHHGRIVLEDRTTVYFVTLRLPRANSAVGDFVKIDGLFLEAYSDEDPENPGTWIDGPLLVASRLERSYPEQEPMTRELVEDALTILEDDTMESGLTGLDHMALWRTMGWVRELPEDAVDWENATYLGRDALKELVANGDAHRLEAYRIPVSKLMGFRVVNAGENPLRADHTTKGWIGNTTWTDVIQFEAPFAANQLKEGDLAAANGFFLKNLSYEPRDGGMRQAPFFVIHSFDPFVPTDDRTVSQLMLIVGSVTIALIIGLWYLLARDARRSELLRRELVRRSRARRAAGRGIGVPGDVATDSSSAP